MTRRKKYRQEESLGSLPQEQESSTHPCHLVIVLVGLYEP